jgi:hypothetical protein
VAAAAYAPRRPAGDVEAPALDDAPVARLIAALGEPSTDAPDAASVSGAPGRRGAPPWIFPLVALLLLGEWGSRRLRGAR